MPEFANDAVENAQVLVNLIRERGPIRVAKEILAVADQVVKANASDQALFQIDHLARVARTVTSEAVREEIGRLQAESEKLSDRVSAVRTAREQVQSAAVAILEPLSALEELIEPGFWDARAGLGKPTIAALDSAASRFDLAKLRAAATSFLDWDPSTIKYVSKDMSREVESYQALFTGFVDGGEYDKQFQMVAKLGHLHRLIRLQDRKIELNNAVTKLQKKLGELSKASEELGKLESHVDRWWGSFSAGIMGRLPDGEMARALAPLVGPIKALDPVWLSRVSQQPIEGR
ncbi:hypothetical protein PQH03_28545 [Ralstonia insidiosa]|jgi:hypothetical protein|uniref:Uncharacterized protein n=1 Tax=Ralstonia insidiosa TaxID=190721 RepID=A0A192A7Z2_9RALS|nr:MULTISPECIES: hypothetical protein [Ralstonia]KMW47577.1 hypothetical protein AC240_08475 [Ralstonia sp. MD27]ANJ76504.1 hypothetical protein A9Y76_28360 [Ralstonia insidiosa]MBA9869634.1 hypothetical protein [Ralstonia insidiosa]MBA9884395.1 hypothetical protein [Ralstonia pickettii]MBA9894117.1 hypothetical protein [Ralstonia pickettii]